MGASMWSVLPELLLATVNIIQLLLIEVIRRRQTYLESLTASALGEANRNIRGLRENPP